MRVLSRRRVRMSRLFPARARARARANVTYRHNNGTRIGNGAADKECFLQRFYEKTRELTPAQIAQALHDVREKKECRKTRQ